MSRSASTTRNPAVETRLKWRAGQNTLDIVRSTFAAMGGLILADTRVAAMNCARRSIRNWGTSSTSCRPSAYRRCLLSGGASQRQREVGPRDCCAPVRRCGKVRRHRAHLQPAASMAVLGTIAGAGDLRHFERMRASRSPQGAPPQSCSLTSKHRHPWRGASRRRATSRSAGAWSVPRTSASSVPVAWSAALSEMGSSPSSSPRQPDRNPPPPAPASPRPERSARRSATWPSAATWRPRTSPAVRPALGLQALRRPDHHRRTSEVNALGDEVNGSPASRPAPAADARSRRRT